MADIEEKMFCFQCEQTLKGTGCTKAGICTKSDETARLQDILICCLKSLCAVCNAIYKRTDGTIKKEIEDFIPEAMFSTLTNVNFEPKDMTDYCTRALAYRDELSAQLTADEKAQIPCKYLCYSLPSTDPAVLSKSALGIVGDKDIVSPMIPQRIAQYGRDIVNLQEIITYGVKGGCAYAFHAGIAGANLTSVVRKFAHFLGDVLINESLTYDALLSECLSCGEACWETMEILDKANTKTFGDPEPVTVQWIKDGADGSEKPGKAILVSGHDIVELNALLEQTAGTGVQIYTHGEMLPALAYPKLRERFPHLAGHYGTAWQNQRAEFAKFPGAILMTSNCYVPALPSYQENIFASVPVNGKGVQKVIHDRNYADVIKRAQELPGFVKGERKHELLIGFGHHAVVDTPVLDAIIDAVAQGKLRHVYLIGGCDGYEKERNQYTELAERLPQDTLMITLACGKFKINGKDYGKVPGTELPRLVDMGQCNDAYSAVQLVLALCKKLNISDPNKLPITYVISWFEQKAVAVLLALLYLGVKDIYLGPKVPAFVTADLAKTLAIHPFTCADDIYKKEN